jgi:hypothetical protein
MWIKCPLILLGENPHVPYTVHSDIYSVYPDGKITQGQSPFIGSQRMQWGHDRHLHLLASTTSWSPLFWQLDSLCRRGVSSFAGGGPPRIRSRRRSAPRPPPRVDLNAWILARHMQERTPMERGVRLGQTSRAKVKWGARSGFPPTNVNNISCNKRNTIYATYECNNWNLECTNEHGFNFFLTP